MCSYLWHLTDDHGWRIESKIFPKLNEIGSSGNHPH
ncbi:family 20 glycosylhydrolase [Paenibacillus sp. Soil750]